VILATIWMATLLRGAAAAEPVEPHPASLALATETT
jgi:hypothetical protein